MSTNSLEHFLIHRPPSSCLNSCKLILILPERKNCNLILMFCGLLSAQGVHYLEPVRYYWQCTWPNPLQLPEITTSLLDYFPPYLIISDLTNWHHFFCLPRNVSYFLFLKISIWYSTEMYIISLFCHNSAI